MHSNFKLSFFKLSFRGTLVPRSLGFSRLLLQTGPQSALNLKAARTRRGLNTTRTFILTSRGSGNIVARTRLRFLPAPPVGAPKFRAQDTSWGSFARASHKSRIP